MKIGKFLNEIGENWNTYSADMKEQLAILVLDSIGSKELFIKNMDKYESVDNEIRISNDKGSWCTISSSGTSVQGTVVTEELCSDDGKIFMSFLSDMDDKIETLKEDVKELKKDKTDMEELSRVVVKNITKDLKKFIVFAD